MDQTVTVNPVGKLLRQRGSGRQKGIYACCSANEYVIRAAIRRAKARDTVVLVEATANQMMINASASSSKVGEKTSHWPE